MSDEKQRQESPPPEADVPTAVPSVIGDHDKSSVDKSDTYEKAVVVDGADKTVPVEADDDIQIEYLSGMKLVLLTFGLAMAIFVVALDNTIIATAIPTITTVFSSLDDVGWYGSSYLLTMTSLQPSFGKLFANFDIKIIYLIALVIFEVGSVVCATATSSEALIVGRAIAGIGASAIFSGGMTIISYSVRLERRPIYLASLASMFGIASVVGPLLGGVFTDRVSWRWCFWINLPFGGIAFAAIFFFFNTPLRKNVKTVREKIAQIDIVGALFLIDGVTCLLLALQWGGTTYPWKNSHIWGLFLGFALLIAIFIVIQIKRQGQATIPPAILMQRTVLVSFLYTSMFSMAMYIDVFYLPFYFQAIKGTSAVGSGIRTIPYLVSITISSVIVGGIITVTGHYAPFLWIGAAIFTIGCGLITTLGVDSGPGKWIGYQVLAGFGGGAGVQIPFLAVQVMLSNAESPIGTAMVMFSNSLGGAISISIAQNIFSNELVKQIPKYAPTVNPVAVIAAGATHIREVIPADLLPGVLQGYAKALQITFIPAVAFAGVSFLVSLFIERANVKGKSFTPGAA